MAEIQRELAVFGGLSELPRISAFIEEACDAAAVHPQARFDLQLAVDEACCNVVEHAYGGAGGELTVRFETRDGDVIITVHDRGQAFDPAQVPPPALDVPLEDRPVGGLGLHLMRQLMDVVSFNFSEQGNTLVMEKWGAAEKRDSPPQRSPAKSKASRQSQEMG